MPAPNKKNTRIWCGKCSDFRHYTEDPAGYRCKPYGHLCRGFRPVKWVMPRDRSQEESC